MSVAALTYQQQILDLAKKHGIDSSEAFVDRMAQAMNRMTGDDVAQDIVKRSLARLGEAGHVSMESCQLLLLGYLEELELEESV